MSDFKAKIRESATRVWKKLRLPLIEGALTAAALLSSGQAKAAGDNERDSAEDLHKKEININHRHAAPRPRYADVEHTAENIRQIAGTNDLSSYVFKAEELKEMKPGVSGRRLITNIKKWAAHYNNEYNCLAAVKRALWGSRLAKAAELDKTKSAYEAIEALDKNDNLIKIGCEDKDLDKIPLALIVYDKGETKHGHIDVVLYGKAYSSKIRNVNKGGYRWQRDRKGRRYKQYYGKKHIYILKDTKLSAQSFEMCCRDVLEKENLNLWGELRQEQTNNPKVWKRLHDVQSKLALRSLINQNKTEGLKIPKNLNLAQLMPGKAQGGRKD